MLSLMSNEGMTTVITRELDEPWGSSPSQETVAVKAKPLLDQSSMIHEAFSCIEDGDKTCEAFTTSSQDDNARTALDVQVTTKGLP